MEISYRKRILYNNLTIRSLICISLVLLLLITRTVATQQEIEDEDDDLEDLEELEEIENDDGKISGAEAVSRAQKIVADLTNDNAERILSSHEYVLLLGYASWCARSSELMPEFSFAATALSDMGSPVLLAKMDGDRHTKAASKYNIKGYPTLLFFVNGTSQVYTGGLGRDEIVIWVRKKTGVPTLRLSSVSEAEQFLKRNQTSAVGLFETFEGVAYEEFVKAATEDNDVQFVEVNKVEVATFLSPEISGLPYSLGLIKSEPEKSVLFEGEFIKETILQFIEVNKYPLVTRLTEHNSAKVYSSLIKLQVFLFAGPHEYESILSVFQDAAKKFKAKIMFILVDSTDENLAKPMLTLFGLEALKPIVTALDNTIGSKYLLESEISASTLENFCSELVAGNILPYYKSEPIPIESKGDVRVVVGKNFDDIVLNSSQDVLLELYAPWCVNCKSVSKLTEKVAKHFKGITSLLVAKIDVSANEHPKLQVDSFPSLLFYRANDKKKPIKASKMSSFKDLIQFVKDNAEVPPAGVKKVEEGQTNAKVKVDSERKEEL